MEKYERLRVTKIDYAPSQYSDAAFIAPLILIIIGVNEKGKRRTLKVSGAKPRIWVTTNPKLVDIPPFISQYITKIEKSGVSFITGEKTWCIYLKYPYGKIVRPLRELFEYHCQADVFFHNAVRGFYGIRAYIKVPRDRDRMRISEIECLKNHAPKNPIETNDYVIDIETSDEKGFADPKNPTAEILCLNIMNKKTKEVYFFITKKIDHNMVVEGCLRNQDFLHAAIEHTKDIMPFTGKVNIYEFYQGDREDNEREMINTLDKLLKKLGVVNIEEYNAYDVAYIHARCKWKNHLISKWNRKHDGNRKYYRKEIFININNYDVEQLYKRFIDKSVQASGKNALDWMGHEELGYGKIGHKEGFQELYDKYPELMAAYNIWDCVLPDRCMDKCGDLMNIRQGQCNYMASELSAWTSQMRLWEAALMYKLENEKILPSTSCVVRDVGMKAGGHVEGQPCDIYFNMIELDNSGEYNGVVMSCRISHEALLASDEDPGTRPISTLPSGRRYYLDVPAIIPDMLKEMTDMIQVYKDKIKTVDRKKDALYSESNGVKTDEIRELIDRLKLYEQQKYIYKSSSLSSTGLYGTAKINQKDPNKSSRPFRLAHGGLASDVTEVGRYHEAWNKMWIEGHPFIWWREPSGQLKIEVILAEISKPEKGDVAEEIVKRVKEGKYYCSTKVLYQDTDSCKTLLLGPLPEGLTDRQMKDFLYLVGNTYSKHLNKSFDEFALITLGIINHNFLIKVDNVYKKYFQWGAKKNYVFKDYNNEVHYKGVKIRKRDIMPLAKSFMIKFFDMVMDDKPKEETLKDISLLINEYESDILSGKYTKECGEPHGVKKETRMWESMVHSNSIFDKTFRMGDVGTFYNIKAIIGHSIPHNKKIALEYGDDPIEFGLKLDYKEVLRKLKDSMKKIIHGLEPGATWESIRDNIARGSFEDAEDELW